MPPDPPTEAATRLLPPLATLLLEPPPIQNSGYANGNIHLDHTAVFAHTKIHEHYTLK